VHQSKGGTWHAFLDHRTKLRANRRQNPSRRHFRPCLLLTSGRRDLRLRGNAGRKNPRVTIGALAIGPISHHRQKSKSLAGDAVTSLRRRRAARLFRRIRCERGHGIAPQEAVLQGGIEFRIGRVGWLQSRPCCLQPGGGALCLLLFGHQILLEQFKAARSRTEASGAAAACRACLLFGVS
jgi:hypothetical protein